ncbi:hypothetical protein Tco_0266569 [Tanacetum coccineum]
MGRADSGRGDGVLGQEYSKGVLNCFWMSKAGADRVARVEVIVRGRSNRGDIGRESVRSPDVVSNISVGYEKDMAMPLLVIGVYSPHKSMTEAKDIGRIRSGVRKRERGGAARATVYSGGRDSDGGGRRGEGCAGIDYEDYTIGGRTTALYNGIHSSLHNCVKLLTVHKDTRNTRDWWGHCYWTSVRPGHGVSVYRLIGRDVLLSVHERSSGHVFVRIDQNTLGFTYVRLPTVAIKWKGGMRRDRRAQQRSRRRRDKNTLVTKGGDDVLESVNDLDTKNMNHNVEKIDDNKEESQTVVMDDVLHVSGPEDNETESTNEVEEQLESKATNDPKVEDDSESMIENNKFVELDENTDDNTETQTVVMDHVQNPLILEDDEVKSLKSQIVNSEYVEFDSKLQTMKEVVEIIDDMQN